MSIESGSKVERNQLPKGTIGSVPEQIRTFPQNIHRVVKPLQISRAEQNPQVVFGERERLEKRQGPPVGEHEHRLRDLGEREATSASGRHGQRSGGGSSNP